MTIDATHAKGMDTDIPFRLCVSLEIPLIRAPWFSVPRSVVGQTEQDIFLEQLQNHDVPYVFIGTQLWFFWADHWCRYDFDLTEEEIRFFLLVYRTIH